MKPSTAANDNLIDRAIETWQPRTERDLSREDARQIVENVTGFFSVLADWAREEKPEPSNDTGKPGGADNGGEALAAEIGVVLFDGGGDEFW